MVASADMTRTTLALVALTLAACSTDPSPSPGGDAQTPDAADVVSELARDVSVAADSDAPALDASRDVPTDTAPDATTVDTQVMDAGGDDAADVSAVDAAAIDSGADVPGDLADAARDTAVDVAADVTSFPSLTSAYTATEIRVLYQSTCVGAGCDSYPVDTVRAPMDCHVDTAGVHFSLQACDPSGCRTVSGLLTTGADAGRGSVVVRTLATVTPRFESGRVYGSPQRQSFHVQFAIDATGASNGASGIPGRTASPDYGDLWLLGCPVM